MFKNILVPIDGSPRSNRAVKAACALARAGKGKLTIFHASPTYSPPLYGNGYTMEWPSETRFMKESSAAAMKVLERAKKLATAQKVGAQVFHSRSDAPAKAILEAARKRRATMIVMASHGRTGLPKLLLGSETQRVLALTKLPVLVVR